MQIKKITTLADALAVLNSEMWSLWAIFPSTVMGQSWLVIRPDGIREVGGQIQVNMVDFDYSTGAYKGEDWRTPYHLYMTRWCDGCHYPPDMCCGDRADLEIDPPAPYTVLGLDR